MMNKKPKKTVKRKVATVVANKFRKPGKKKFEVKAVKPKKKKTVKPKVKTTVKKKVVTAVLNKLRKPEKKKFEVKVKKGLKYK
tara:strand:+ start:591 stop:839 length:249 start_codon:yes stop_codon:yes gene_type:complete